MRYLVYCDESSLQGAEYRVIGGILLPRRFLEIALHGFASLRDEKKLWAEMHWTNISDGWLADYKLFLDVFFEAIEKCSAQFHALIVDNREWNRIGKHVLSLNPEYDLHYQYCQLLMHKFGRRTFYSDRYNELKVFVDEGQFIGGVEDLRTRLNLKLCDYRISHAPFKSIRPLDSKQSDLLQVCDVLIGAIAYHANNRHLKPDAKASKCEMAEFVRSRFKVATLADSTPSGRQAITLWKFQSAMSVPGGLARGHRVRFP